MKSQFNFTLSLKRDMHIISFQVQVSVGIPNQGLFLPFCSPLEKKHLAKSGNCHKSPFCGVLH